MGWNNLPDGASNDPNAPYNKDDERDEKSFDSEESYREAHFEDLWKASLEIYEKV